MTTATSTVAFGLKAHSGWAALVVLAAHGRDRFVVDRRRIELVEEKWARQPYHAAEPLAAAKARDLVTRGIAAADRIAAGEIRAAVEREHQRGHDVSGCAVLVGSAMPDWTVDEIRAVHFRMHKAEGVLFRDALIRGAQTCGLRVVAIPEKTLLQDAERALGTPASTLAKTMATLGTPVGPPWGKDQKDAALAAMIALGSTW